MGSEEALEGQPAPCTDHPVQCWCLWGLPRALEGELRPGLRDEAQGGSWPPRPQAVKAP